jgi:methylase of polypeptide subunit release factors
MIESLKSRLDADSSALQQLRQILKESGYCGAGVAPTFCDVALQLPDESTPPTRLNTLLRLFHFKEPVGTENASKALHPLTIEELADAGFIRMDGENVRANVLIQPYQDLLFAIDELENRPESALMQISGSSLLVAHLMVRRPSRTSLDLGTGCGFLAALLAQHSEHVYAVDLNPTAVKFADFNCRWNGLRRVTCLEGNLTAPVRDKRFDLIVCNPPFMICPVPSVLSSRIRFKHSGEEGDEFCINLAREASQLLHEDGYFHMIFEWLELDGEDWKAKLTTSFSGTDCDVWGMRMYSRAAEVYVSEWLADEKEIEEVDTEALYREGVRYFQHRNVKSIGSGLLTMRRCSRRPNFLWFDEAPEDQSEPYGESVSTLFDIRIHLSNSSDAVLLEEKLMVSPDVGMIQKAQLEKGHWEVTESELNRYRGLKYCFTEASPLLLRSVALMDGNCTLRQIFERLSHEEHLALTEIIAKHLREIRELIWFGFLIPTSISTDFEVIRTGDKQPVRAAKKALIASPPAELVETSPLKANSLTAQSMKKKKFIAYKAFQAATFKKM